MVLRKGPNKQERREEITRRIQAIAKAILHGFYKVTLMYTGITTALTSGPQIMWDGVS